MIRDFFLPRIIYVFYKLLSWTWRFQEVSNPAFDRITANNEPIVFAHWHRDELSIVHLVTKYRIATMTSTSRDGKLIDYVIQKLGGATAKGSSTRGGSAALLGLTRLVGEGYRGSMAVDGPRGPIYQAKPGVFEISRLANAWIVPAGIASSPRFVFEKSWNKARLPLPFSKVVLVFGEPSRRQVEDPRSAELSFELAQAINNCCRKAEAVIAGSTSSSLTGSSH